MWLVLCGLLVWIALGIGSFSTEAGSAFFGIGAIVLIGLYGVLGRRDEYV